MGKSYRKNKEYSSKPRGKSKDNNKNYKKYGKKSIEENMEEE